MNIVLCVKQVPESYTVRLDPVTNTLQRDKARAIANPFDLFAAEEAVRLKERFGGKISAVSMGIPAAAAVLSEVMAMGADEGFLLSDRAFAGADTLATGYTLAQGIRKQSEAGGGFDLIICGRMATDGDTAQVPPILAEFLGIPCLTDVCEILSYSKQTLTVRRMGDDRYGIWSVKTPALVTVTKEINVPRLPSISGLRYAASHPVTLWAAGDFPSLDRSRLGLAGSATQVKKTFIPENKIDVQMIAGNATQQASSLAAELQKRRLL